jgi:hypothetical protein
LPPCTESTPIQLFAASTTADSDIPTGAATPKGMHAIRITTMSKTIAFCLFVSIFSRSPFQKRAFRGSISMAFAMQNILKKQIKEYIADFTKDSAFYQIKRIKKDRLKA